MNRAAQQLARMTKGKPKTMTPAALAQRRKSLVAARAKRWPAKIHAKNTCTIVVAS